MRPGLLVSVRHFLSLISVIMYRSWRSYLSRIPTTGSFRLIRSGNHLCSCPPHSGVKKVHDWVVDGIDDLFCTNHKGKTQQVVKSRGQWCGDIKLSGHLTNVTGSVSLVLDLRIVHEHWGSSSDPSINGHLHYLNDIDRSLNEDTTDNIWKYRDDYNLSCHVSPDVSWRQPDVRYQVTWRNWRSCGKCNSLYICPIHFKFCASSSSSPPPRKGHVTVLTH
jgi:hypothetical protein